MASSSQDNYANGNILQFICPQCGQPNCINVTVPGLKQCMNVRCGAAIHIPDSLKKKAKAEENNGNEETNDGDEEINDSYE